MGSDGPEHGTDPSWFGGGKAFLTLGTQGTAATITDASHRAPVCVVWWAGQTLLDHLQIQECVVFASRNDAQTGGQDIGQRSGVAIQVIKADQVWEGRSENMVA
jgi:hypothetical protein